MALTNVLPQRGTATQPAELAELHAFDSRMDTLMAEIRALGHIPRQCRKAENALSHRLYIAKRKRQLSESQLAELATLARSRIEPLPELTEPPDPQDPFGGYAANHFEQDLLMSTSGILTQELRRRVFRYQRYMTQFGAEELDVVRKCKDKVFQAYSCAAIEVRTAARVDTVLGEIRALGHIPRETIGLADESSLALRLRTLKSRNLLSESELAELAQLPGSEPRDASQRAAQRMDTLMADIRGLGCIPRRTVTRPEEYCLAARLGYAKRKCLLNESQLAELEEISRSSVEPRRKRQRVLKD